MSDVTRQVLECCITLHVRRGATRPPCLQSTLLVCAVALAFAALLNRKQCTLVTDHSDTESHSRCRWGTEIEAEFDEDDAAMLLTEHIPRASGVYSKRAALAANTRQSLAKPADVAAPADTTCGEMHTVARSLLGKAAVRSEAAHSVALAGAAVVLLHLPPARQGCLLLAAQQVRQGCLQFPFPSQYACSCHSSLHAVHGPEAPMCVLSPRHTMMHAQQAVMHQTA